ncbi:hypothetical protein CHUAL_002271 [Chamberlinius hualienensis]
MMNLKSLRNLYCRRSFKCLTIVVITGIIVVYFLHQIWNSEEQDFYLEHHSHFDTSETKLNGGIVMVTGRSYESRFGHVKVYLCKTSQVVRPDENSVVWSNLIWQPAVDNPNNRLFILSAYYDVRLRRFYGSDKHGFVRLLTMLEGNSSDVKFYCQMWLGKNFSRPVVVDAELQDIWFSEKHEENYFGTNFHEYRPYLVSCILPKKFSSLNVSPAFVSITLKPCVNATNVFRITDPKPATEEVNRRSKPKFAICVKPLDFDKEMSLNLIQWLEINFLLGADQIDIYTLRIHPNTLQILNYYQKFRKNVRVFPSTLPGKQPNFPLERSLFLKRNIWQKRRNELVPYNDCLYRNMYSHDYVIPLDIDEILVPKMHRNWVEVFEFLNQSKLYVDKMNYYASYAVRNAYYLESLNSNNETSDKPDDSSIFKQLYRSANYSDANKAVKSFVRTDKTLTVFNHYALEAVVPGVGRNIVLPVELIQMNHYRKTCPASMPSDCKNNFLKYKVYDDILVKYQNEIEQRTRDVLKNIKLN